MNAVMMPRIGLNESENMLGEICVKEGDTVKQGDELFTVETDKSSLSVYAETSGTVLKIFYSDNDPVEVLTPVCVIGEPGDDITEFEPDNNKDLAVETDENKNNLADEHNTEIKTAVNEPLNDEIVRISPRAKRLAESNGIDYMRIYPSGAENRIIEKDIINAISGKAVYRDVSESEKVKFTKIRSLIASNMMHSLHNSAQLTNHCSFDAGKLLIAKEKYKSEGKKITVGDIIVFILSRTLKEFKNMNAHMVSDDEIIIHEKINIGIAVDTERGLMVPAIMNADKLSIEEISIETKSLAEECRNGSIHPDKLKNGTFTVSNIGSFGIQYFTPILNPPQIGILGIGAIDYKVKKTVNGMEFYPAGFLSLTYDHRAIDGAPASRFMRALCDNLESYNSEAE